MGYIYIYLHQYTPSGVLGYLQEAVWQVYQGVYNRLLVGLLSCFYNTQLYKEFCGILERIEYAPKRRPLIKGRSFHAPSCDWLRASEDRVVGFRMKLYIHVAILWREIFQIIALYT